MRHARDSDDTAAHATELIEASGVAVLKHVHDDTNEAVTVLDELAISSKVEGLEEETEACLDKDLVTVEAERKAQLALVQEFNNLDDALAGITNSYYG